MEDVKLSKMRMRKITKDGPFQGKNKVFFDASGKPISSLEYHLKQDALAGKTQDQEEDKLIIREESEASSIGSEDEERYIKSVKTALKENVDADKQTARQRLTEMRLKKKRKLRARRGDDDQADGDESGVVVTLGGADNEEEESGEAHQSEEEPEEEVKPVKVSKKKRVKTVSAKEAGNEEDRALALLGMDDF